MNNKDQDPNLQAPQEANTRKHINFREAEETDADSSTGNNSSQQEDNSPTKKAWEELRNETNVKDRQTD
jgi:hypothetical protein